MSVEPFAVAGQPFSQGLRATITKASGHDFAVQLVAPTAQPVEKGDVLLATFYLRAAQPSTASEPARPSSSSSSRTSPTPSR